MSTRCQVFVKIDGEPVATMFRHYDGYPTGMGKDLVQMLAKCETAQELTVMLLTAWNFDVELEPIDAKHGDTEYEYTVDFHNGWDGSGDAPTLTIYDRWIKKDLTFAVNLGATLYPICEVLENFQDKHCN